MNHAANSPAHVLRTGSSQSLWWAVFVLCVVAVGSLALSADPVSALVISGLPVGLAIAVWAAFGQPRVLLEEEGLGVVNVIREYGVPFALLRDIDPRMGLTLVLTDGSKISAWAIPSSGRRIVREGTLKARVERADAEPIVRVRNAWTSWHATHSAPTSPHPLEVSRRTRWGVVAALSGAGIWASLALFYLAG